MRFEHGKDKVPVHVRMDPFLIAALDFYAARARVTRSQLMKYCIQKALPKDLVPDRAMISNRFYYRTRIIDDMRKALRSAKNMKDFQEAEA